ncbi:MAG: class I SAM-dependent methyltransferase [Paracoccaceae bacterium]
MDLIAVEKTYARWAPIYDFTFGYITAKGRARVTGCANDFGDTVLDVCIGTGLSLENYSDNVTVTGVDFSDEMLEKAREKVAKKGLKQIRSLRQMDARRLDFADNSFDTVVAMHIMSVVPDPERVMAEMARVVRPGGQVILLNHFASQKGPMAAVERMFAPLADVVGWHSNFDRAAVMNAPSLRLEMERASPPFGLMRFMLFRKDV